MPKYTIDGQTYTIPENEIEGFEAAFPDATIEYHNGSEKFNVPLNERSGFLAIYPNATTSAPTTDDSQPHPDSTIAKVREEVKSEVSQPSTAQVDYEALGVKAPAWEKASTPQRTFRDDLEGAMQVENIRSEIAEQNKKRTPTQYDWAKDTNSAIGKALDEGVITAEQANHYRHNLAERVLPIQLSGSAPV